MVHTWHTYPNRAGSGEHVPFLVVAVANHQAAAVLIDLIAEPHNINGDLGLKCRGQHLAGTVRHDLVHQRPTPHQRSRWTNPLRELPSAWAYLPDQRANAGLDRIPESVMIIPGKVRPPKLIHRH